MVYGQQNSMYPMYGYQNQFNPYSYGQNVAQQQISQPVIQSNIPHSSTQSNAIQSSPSLFGKVVDCLETAKSQDVPIGMSGVYPKADGTAVFIKQWCADGTTKTCEYRLVESNIEESSRESQLEEKLNEISANLDSLAKKLDKLKLTSSSPAPQRKKKVEEDEDYE